MKWFSEQFLHWRQKHFGKIVFDDPRPVARSAPYTYYLPPTDHINVLKPGDTVKLIFRSQIGKYNYGAERMWVEISERNNDIFKGILHNTPYDLPQISYGDMIEFKAFNIIDIDWDDDALKARGLARLPEKQIWDRCMVDDAVVDGSVKVEFLYRETPDMDQQGDKYPDSGWRIRGDVRNMTDEQYENGTASYLALGVVLNKDDSWIHLIDSPIGSAFLKNWETGEFEVTKRTEADEP